MIQGIGLVYAKRMEQVLGKDVVNIIETSPGRLRELDRSERRVAGRDEANTGRLHPAGGAGLRPLPARWRSSGRLLKKRYDDSLRRSSVT